MPFGEITVLQFFVLATLLDGELPGRDVRDRLEAQGAPMKLSAFYRLMGRLEDAGFIEGRYERGQVANERVRFRIYKITAAGLVAWQKMRSLCLTASPRVGLVGGV
jgi:DNA-binding PadR family transcriptional regulator